MNAAVGTTQLATTSQKRGRKHGRTVTGKRKVPGSTQAAIDSNGAAAEPSMNRDVDAIINDARALLQQIQVEAASADDSNGRPQMDSETIQMLVEMSIEQIEHLIAGGLVLDSDQSALLNRLKQFKLVEQVPKSPQVSVREKPAAVTKLSIDDSELAFLLKEYGPGVTKRLAVNNTRGLCVCNIASCIGDASASNYCCRSCRGRMFIWHCMEPKLGATSVCSSCLLAYDPNLSSVLFQVAESKSKTDPIISSHGASNVPIRLQNHLVDLTSESNLNDSESLNDQNSKRECADAPSQTTVRFSNIPSQGQFVDLTSESNSNTSPNDHNFESDKATVSSNNDLEFEIKDFIVPLNRPLVAIFAVGESESDFARANFWATRKFTEEQLLYILPDSAWELSWDQDTMSETVIVAVNTQTALSSRRRRYFHVSGDFKTLRGVQAIFSEIDQRFGRLPDIVILDYFWLQAGWFDFGHYGSSWVNHVIYTLTEAKSINKVKTFIVPVDKRGDMLRLVSNDKTKLDDKGLEVIPISEAHALDKLFLVQWDEELHSKDPKGKGFTFCLTS